MNQTEARKKYKDKISINVWYDYRRPDYYQYINNNDPDLQVFKIRLPQPPDWGLIDGFGLPAFDQVFKHEQIPERLKILESDIRRKRLRDRSRKESRFLFERFVNEDVWFELENNSKDFQYEISWIKRMWYYREFGKWIFINGKITYLPNWFWFFLNWFPLEGVKEHDGRPSYRDRDRQWFIAQQYAATTTEAPVYDRSGEIILLADGTPKMQNMGARTVFGTNVLKHRRAGDTSKALSIILNTASSFYEHYNGIQGNKESTAEGIYKEKLLFAFKKMPFFFLPDMPNFNHASELVFRSPEFRGGLNSKIDYATTALRHFYDGKKLTYIFSDEVGKTIGESVDRRHEVLKRCIAPGVKIQGFMMNASTVDEMELTSAKEFEKLSRASHFDNRMPNGQTQSGLLNLYWPSYTSYEGFIDRFGMPIINEPTKDQVPYMGRIVRNEKGRIMGCREYLEHIEDNLRKSGDLMRLTEFQRQNPKSWKECWANVGKNFFFNTNILRARISYLSTLRDVKIVRGDFVWTAGFGSNVEFIENEATGKFIKSMDIEPARRSQWIWNGAFKRPVYNDIFISSADPFRLEKTEGYRMSDGSGATLYMHDPNIDTENIDIRDYKTNRFVCTYLNRPPTKDEYCEDMLKCCIYWGSLMFAENNIDIINDYFLRKGYKGYLLYNIDPESGRKKQNAGFSTSGPTIKKKLFNLVSDWINLHGHRCDHPEILDEMLEIEGPDDMTNHDLFVAVAGCLLGQESRYVGYMRELSSQKLNVKEWWT
jgi:hypothetical protein